MKVAEAILEIGYEINPSEALDALEGKIDKNELLKLRLENSNFYFKQGMHVIDFPSISCEMLYQSILEALKCLKDYFGIQNNLRESIPLLSNILGDWVSEAWDLALKLHYDGYILEIVDREEIVNYAPKIKEFLENCEIVITS